MQENNKEFRENNKEISLIKKRILLYLDYKGITLYKCYKETGISKNVLSQKNGLSEENLTKFLKTYTEVNPTWVVIGELSMLNKESEQKKESVEDHNVYKDLVSTQKVLINRQDKLYSSLEKETQDLKKQVERLKNELENARGYSLVAEPSVKLTKKQP